MITQTELKEILDYDPNTGVFRWKVSRNNTIKSGSIAGTKHPSGYINIKINGKLYRAHRLAWLWVHGLFPIKDLDHINGIRDDNRIGNLRECNKSENGQNIKIYKNNTSGYMGVTRFKNKWAAQIAINGIHKNLGYYDTPEEAHQVYLKAKEQLHTFQPTLREAA